MLYNIFLVTLDFFLFMLVSSDESLGCHRVLQFLMPMLWHIFVSTIECQIDLQLLCANFGVNLHTDIAVS